MNSANGWTRKKRKKQGAPSRTAYMPHPDKDDLIPVLPVRFTPKFWQDADQSLPAIRRVRRRYELIKEHCGGGESAQRDLLCQRVAFVSVILETQEILALQDGSLAMGLYIQASNNLTGLLKTLGLDKRMKNVTDLKSYLDEREERH